MTNPCTDLDLIRTRNLKWHRLVWPGGDQALVDDYNQIGADRRALIAAMDSLRAENDVLRAMFGGETRIECTTMGCPKCGKPDFSIPRMGLFHVCPTATGSGHVQELST